jgi:hypothetical protein
VLGGCGTGQDRNTATINATASIPIDATKAKQDLDKVVNALEKMRKASDTANLKELHGDLRSQASELRGSLADLDASSLAAITTGKDQITQWHKQADGFTDAELRNASNKREAGLRQGVDELAASRQTFMTTNTAFGSQLDQVVKALDLDLTQQGVQSIKGVISKLVDDESTLRSSINDVTKKSRAVHEMVNP